MNRHDATSDGSNSPDHPSPDDVISGRPDDKGQSVAPSFEHKGIGSSIFLTAAAAVVPMIIVGVAAITNLTGRGPKGGKR